MPRFARPARVRWLAALALVAAAAGRSAAADEPALEQAPPTFTTIFLSPLVVEGLTADRTGSLYAAGRGGTPCPVYRVPAEGGAATVVGTLPAPCSPNGLAFGPDGELYVTGGADTIYRLRPDAANPPAAARFASGVPGANGIAFDGLGRLWATDGATGQGRVWRIARDGTVTEAFRVPPLASDVDAAAGPGGAVVGGLGRDVRTLPPGAVTFTPGGRSAADTAGSVAIVANGIALTPDGALLVADTARGALWKVRLGADGEVRSPTGCDAAFPADTLCLDDLLVEHPALEGLDGIALDMAGDVWGVANERNALVRVTPRGQVREVFRNRIDPATRLRNGGPLEYPTSPFLFGRRLCISQTDVNRRDNAPNTGGEVMPGGVAVSKIACMDRPTPLPGLPLPGR